MKSILKKLIGSLLLIVLVTGVSAQKKEERKEKRQKAYLECLQLIESGEFKFEAEKAYPQGGSSIDLTTNYGFIKVSENKSIGDLPFFGRAYRVDYGADGGINFEGDIEDLEEFKVDFNFLLDDLKIQIELKNINYSTTLTEIQYDAAQNVFIITVESTSNDIFNHLNNDFLNLEWVSGSSYSQPQQLSNVVLWKSTFMIDSLFEPRLPYYSSYIHS